MGNQDQPMDCRVYVIKAVGNQEYNVAYTLKSRVEQKGLDKVKITAIVVLPTLKGFVFVEGSMPYEIQDLATDIKHYRGMVRGVMRVDELLRGLAKPAEVNVGDVVEIIVEPFRGYRGKVVDIDKEKGQVTLELLDSPSTMPIVMNLKEIRKIESK
ncbi:MAG: transcription elongation factor Spt5 [Vulcanisaeta sp. AZ3]